MCLFNLHLASTRLDNPQLVSEAYPLHSRSRHSILGTVFVSPGRPRLSRRPRCPFDQVSGSFFPCLFHNLPRAVLENAQWLRTIPMITTCHAIILDTAYLHNRNTSTRAVLMSQRFAREDQPGIKMGIAPSIDDISHHQAADTYVLELERQMVTLGGKCRTRSEV